MNKEIQIEMRNVFGVDRIYPVCHIANALVQVHAWDPIWYANASVMPT